MTNELPKGTDILDATAQSHYCFWNVVTDPFEQHVHANIQRLRLLYSGRFYARDLDYNVFLNFASPP